MPSFAHRNMTFIYLFRTFGAFQIHSCLFFISGWMAYEGKMPLYSNILFS
jgi:hypothetical protein